MKSQKPRSGRTDSERMDEIEQKLGLKEPKGRQPKVLGFKARLAKFDAEIAEVKAALDWVATTQPDPNPCDEITLNDGKCWKLYELQRWYRNAPCIRENAIKRYEKLKSADRAELREYVHRMRGYLGQAEEYEEMRFLDTASDYRRQAAEMEADLHDAGHLTRDTERREQTKEVTSPDSPRSYTLSRDASQVLLELLDKGPSARERYTTSRKSRDRYAGTLLLDELGLDAESADDTLAAWIARGYIAMEPYTSRGKYEAQGIVVLRRPQKLPVVIAADSRTPDRVLTSAESG